MSRSPTRVRLVIAEGHTLILRGLRALLEAEPAIDVVGEAGDVRQLTATVLRRRPSIVMTGTDLPGGDLTGALARIDRSTSPRPGTVLLVHGDLSPLEALDALRRGVRGMVFKDEPTNDLIAAAVTVARGGALFSPRIAPLLVTGADEAARTDGPPVHGRPGPDSLGRLTRREAEVFRLVAQGASNPAIAARLSVSEATVKSHFNRVCKKLGLTNRVEAVIHAYESGVVRGGGRNAGRRCSAG
ncbi:LuxR C-terminal-related transcriptional regulator [Nocardiopsis baichengensis]|uniref:LuxR C-terminal-related transcriptional regulator n=1 Tax=Nocardiopsis baichengensis TaxID=280240 RepID=UPI00034A4079|nr:response regulator transcription factor [Nocardiopsis baichengensis]